MSHNSFPLPASGFRRVAAIVFAAAALSGCRQDMHNTVRAKPLRESVLFKNASSARTLVEGTVARGTLEDDAAFFTGKDGAAAVDALPFALTADVLNRGEERFNIYCSPCHGPTGQGDGMIVRRGYRQPPSFHLDRLRQAPLGHFYDTATNGFGAMPDYKAQVSPRDRWAIAAYIRALQLSQHAVAAELTDEDRQKLSRPAAAEGKPAGGGAGEHKQ